jgi:uncharacterized membrane protein (UPF0127 family)
MRIPRSLTALAGAVLIALPALAQQQFASFSKGELTIQTSSGPQKFAIELATDDAQREQGLMYRTRMAADAGMLFLYPHEQPVAMWMKNTNLPLDMLFIAADGHVRNISERAVPQSLELNAGTVERLGIKPGDKVVATGLGE